MNIERIDKRQSARIKDRLKSEHNTITVRESVIILKRVWDAGPEDMVQYIKRLVEQEYGKKYVVQVLDVGEVWPGKNAHRYVKFNLLQNDEMVEVLVTIGGPPRKVMIRAYDEGGCCDPSTETYWSM